MPARPPLPVIRLHNLQAPQINNTRYMHEPCLQGARFLSAHNFALALLTS